MKFIHTSDWHLGKFLFDVSLLEEQKNALQQLKNLLKEEKPDALFISGDIYDRSIPPPEAIEIFDDFLNTAIIDLKIPTVIISGNHDSPKRISFGSKIFNNSNLFLRTSLESIKEPIEFKDEWGSIFVYTFPYYPLEYLKEYLSDSEITTVNNAVKLIIENIKSLLKPQFRNILLAHLFVRGGVTSESERILSVGGNDQVDSSIFNGFDYIALGHLHKPQKISDNIYYSGSLCKYSFSEVEHKKNFYVVEIDGNRNVSIKEIPVKLKKDLRIIEGTIENILKEGERDTKKDDYILARLTDDMIYDPIGKLKTVYPNVLKIERPEKVITSSKTASYTKGENLNPLEIFKNFMKDIAQRDIKENEEKILKEIISEVKKEMEDL